VSVDDIKVGDLVVVVRGHCAGQEERLLGKIKTVTDIYRGSITGPCPWCGEYMAQDILLAEAQPSTGVEPQGCQHGCFRGVSLAMNSEKNAVLMGSVNSSDLLGNRNQHAVELRSELPARPTLCA
jgi:hypothetical protein